MKISLSLRRLAKSLMWTFFKYSDTRFTLQSGISVPVGDRNEMATFREIFIKRDYDPFLDLLSLPSTVLDLGCNSGYFAILMIDRAYRLDSANDLPKFVLVDANETAVKRAQEVISGCGLDPDISYVTGLVGSREESAATFFIAPASAESSAHKRIKRSREVKVKCLDMSELMDNYFSNGVDLIKCDIEGGEELLIRNWAEPLARARALLIEWHGFSGTWEAFIIELDKLGFSLASEHPTGRFKNALFIRRYPNL